MPAPQVHPWEQSFLLLPGECGLHTTANKCYHMNSSDHKEAQTEERTKETNGPQKEANKIKELVASTSALASVDMF